MENPCCYIIPTLEQLRHLGFEPSNLLDIGAAHGHFAEVAKQVWPGTNLHLVEANSLCEPMLRKLDADIKFVALSDSEKVSPFYQDSQSPVGGGNSLYRELTPAFSNDRVSIVPIATRTLESLWPGDIFDFIKIDTQGSELDILRGGLNVLANAKVVMIECSICHYNDGAPLIDEVVRFMQDHNFLIFDITGPFGGGFQAYGRKIQVDVVFIRKDLEGFLHLPNSRHIESVPEKSKKQVAFLLDVPNRPTPYNGTLMRESVGISGTETSTILFAEEMAKNGYQVDIISSHVIPGMDMGVNYILDSDYIRRKHYNIIFDSFLGNATKYDLFCDELFIVMHCPQFSPWIPYPQELDEVRKRMRATRIRLTAPSQWARDTVLQLYPSLSQFEFDVLGNFVDTDSIPFDMTRKRRNHFVFNSSYERGGDIFKSIYYRLPLPGKSMEMFSYLPKENASYRGKNSLYDELNRADFCLFPLVLPNGLVHKDTYNCSLHEAMAAGAICVAPRIRPLESLWGDSVLWVDLPFEINPDLNHVTPFSLDRRFLSNEFIDAFVKTIMDMNVNPDEKEEFRHRATNYAREMTTARRFADWLEIIN